jgi:predicted metal-dependent hydrolase
MQQPLGHLSFDDLSRPPSPPITPPPVASAPAPASPPGSLTYALERSARRKSSIHISVLPDLTVRVVAPQRLPKTRIDALLRQRLSWIDKQREIVQAAKVLRIEREWTSGERLPLLDEPLELRVQSVAGQKVVRAIRKDAFLDVWVPAGVQTVDPIRRVVYKWYGQQAQQVFAQRVLHFTARLGVEPSRVLVRNQSSRWGSCASDGSLRFCWRLILAPQRILDYVVVHELSHLKHPHHQPPFWACVASILPDYMDLRAELKRDGDTYKL